MFLSESERHIRNTPILLSVMSSNVIHRRSIRLPRATSLGRCVGDIATKVQAVPLCPGFGVLAEKQGPGRYGPWRKSRSGVHYGIGAPGLFSSGE